MPETAQWLTVDEGWGRRAADFATLSEPANCREYTALHHLLKVGRGDRLLDLACGAGLAVELATIRGASCAGIDASPRLVAVARDRVPEGDLRVGDMAELPWGDGSFDVVTSCRGIWATTPAALTEARRVLTPGGRLGLTVWGHLKASPGAWALRPFTLASPEKVKAQAEMVSLGRPGVGEEVLSSLGFSQVQRHDVPFAWEFADPESYARALSSTGPAYEAIRSIGEEEFHRYAVAVATEQVRAGLPLRAQIHAVAFTARAPQPRPRTTTYLGEALPSPEGDAMLESDREELGFEMNATKLWLHDPAAQQALFDLLGQLTSGASLSQLDRGVLVCASASTVQDAYCSLAWGRRLSELVGADVAAGVLLDDDAGLDERSRALARWARLVAGRAGSVQPDDVEQLRSCGLDDAQILAVTVYVSLRVAFSSTNAALGAHPDLALAESVPAPVRDAVSYGRPPH